MEKGNLSRRGFMQRSLAALTIGAGLPAWYARDVFAAEQDEAGEKQRGGHDPIVMGAIGVGSPQSRGSYIMMDALRHKGVHYVAVCDVDRRHCRHAAEILRKQHQSEVKEYEDFRHLLDRKDINAVTIATPDHWHVLVAIDALRKGKDVYCEKPLTLTIEEGKALVKVVKETGRVFQVGSQQRSDHRFRLACLLVRNGRLGKIKTVETRIGSNPTSPQIPRVQVPEGLNWDFWLGPTPEADYVALRQGKTYYARCPYEFRWWYAYSGGKMTDWGAHHNDIAQWALGMDDSGPVEVEGKGKQPEPGPNRYDTHPDFRVTYTYANGTRLICQSRGENGVRFEGEDGKWIFVSRSRIAASDPALLDEKLPEHAVRLYVSNDHMGNFLDCMHSRKRTVCPASVGHRSATVCHLGVIALRSGKKLRWDPAREVFVGDEEADKWLSRPMRKPWRLDV